MDAARDYVLDLSINSDFPQSIYKGKKIITSGESNRVNHSLEAVGIFF